MSYTTTNLLPRNLSKVLPNKTASTLAEIVFLFLLGVIAMIILNLVKLPMHLPGKQGLVFVTLVVTGRGLSGLPYASTVSCTGSAFMILNILHSLNPFGAVTYVFIGIVMDLIYNFTNRFTMKPWIIATASGIAWMFMPVFRLIFSSFADVPMFLFSTGLLYPFLTYLIFGFTGGLAGAGILSLINLKK